MVSIDDGLTREPCKLDLNDAKRIRHYWQSKNKECECGCKERVYISGRAMCLMQLIEMLNDLGYSVSKNYRVDSNGKNKM